MTNQIAKAGKLLLVDSGSYSDYSVMGFFVILQDFCPQEELTQYLLGTQSDTYFNEDKFLAFLLKKGLLLEIAHDYLHVGDYGSSDDFRFTTVR